MYQVQGFPIWGLWIEFRVCELDLKKKGILIFTNLKLKFTIYFNYECKQQTTVTFTMIHQ